MKSLTNQEAEKLLKEFGANELIEFGVVSPFSILFRQIRQNFVIYLLVFAAILSFFVGKGITGYVILLVVFLIIGVGFVQEYRAEQSIQALRQMITPVSTVIRSGREMEIASSKLVPGDVILLRSGERIPADGILIKGNEVRVDESVLTGESVPVKKTAIKNEQKPTNVMYMGTFVVNGKAVMRITSTGMQTKFGKISSMISTAEKELPLQKKINKITKVMALAAIVFALTTGAFVLKYGPPSDTMFADVIILMIALSVAAFPEALPVVLITCLSYGAFRMAKQNAIVNRMSVIETLGETTVICSDKTGTITKGEMTVKRIYADETLFSVSGTGFSDEGNILFRNKKVKTSNNTGLGKLLVSSVLCNDARIERSNDGINFNVFGSPTESALLVMGAKGGVFKDDIKLRLIQEIPFDSDRKMMSVMYKGEGKIVYSKGAPEFLLHKCSHIQKGGRVVKLTSSEKERILKVNSSLASEVLRTIAFAYKSEKKDSKKISEDGFVFLGLAGMEDPPRKEVKEAIKSCLLAGIQVKMITGDNKETAREIAREIGLKGNLLEGSDIDTISDEELRKLVGKTIVFARVKPEHKLRIVRALKANGEIVTMTGDGVNDAPALKEAHIGVAMGKNGTDVSRSVADLTLKDDNFATIVSAIKEGRTIFKNIRKFLNYLLSCKYAELCILFIGVILGPYLGWEIPILLALHILFMNLVTDDFPAITLSLTPPSKAIMEEKPRKNRGLVNKGLIVWSLIAGLTIGFISLLVYFIIFTVLNEGTAYARTVTLVTLISLEVLNAYNFLSFRRLVSFKSLFANKYLLYATFASFGATLVVVYTPLNKVFQTVPLGWIEWAVALSGAVSIVLLFNVLKLINNKFNILRLDV